MTTSRATGESPSTSPPSSRDFGIDIHVFHCGHGDTILIRLPGDRWGLIDCYLQEQFGIRRAFFSFIEQNHIKRLEFIIQTHPDRDHYHGMRAVIEYFLGRGERVKYYIDTGLTARRARDLLLNRPARAEYQVPRIPWKNGTVRVRSACEHSKPATSHLSLKGSSVRSSSSPSVLTRTTRDV